MGASSISSGCSIHPQPQQQQQRQEGSSEGGLKGNRGREQIETEKESSRVCPISAISAFMSFERSSQNGQKDRLSKALMDFSAHLGNTSQTGALLQVCECALFHSVRTPAHTAPAHALPPIHAAETLACCSLLHTPERAAIAQFCTRLDVSPAHTTFLLPSSAAATAAHKQHIITATMQCDLRAHSAA